MHFTDEEADFERQTVRKQSYFQKCDRKLQQSKETVLNINAKLAEGIVESFHT